MKQNAEAVRNSPISVHANTSEKKKAWTDGDNIRLNSLWNKIPSTALIAAIMGRSKASVQTQACRLNLLQRNRAGDHHRRKWTSTEQSNILTYIENVKQKKNAPSIQVIAHQNGRSIDAVYAKIMDLCNDDRMVAKLIFDVERKNGATLLFSNDKPEKKLSTEKKPDNKRKTKKCLKCGKLFPSEGNHNWICPRCKENDDWY